MSFLGHLSSLNWHYLCGVLCYCNYRNREDGQLEKTCKRTSSGLTELEFPAVEFEEHQTNGCQDRERADKDSLWWCGDRTIWLIIKPIACLHHFCFLRSTNRNALHFTSELWMRVVDCRKKTKRKKKELRCSQLHLPFSMQVFACSQTSGLHLEPMVWAPLQKKEQR